jgi:hypothetical protein
MIRMFVGAIWRFRPWKNLGKLPSTAVRRSPLAGPKSHVLRRAIPPTVTKIASG